MFIMINRIGVKQRKQMLADVRRHGGGAIVVALPAELPAGALDGVAFYLAKDQTIKQFENKDGWGQPQIFVRIGNALRAAEALEARDYDDDLEMVGVAIWVQPGPENPLMKYMRISESVQVPGSPRR